VEIRINSPEEFFNVTGNTFFFQIVTNLQHVKIADCSVKMQGFFIVLSSDRDEFYKDRFFFTQLKYRVWFLSLTSWLPFPEGQQV